MTDVTDGTGELLGSGSDKEIASRLEAIDGELTALVDEREAILADVDDTSSIARLFTRTLVGYSSVPGANNVKLEPDTGPELGVDTDLEPDAVTRLENIDDRLGGESDPAIRAALLDQVGPLLDQVTVARYYRNPRLTNVRNNFALGSYYDTVNVGVTKGK